MYGLSLVYTVHMKKYSVSMVRERFSEALDTAARGEPVFIERKGVLYRLSVERPKKPRKSVTPRFEIIDRALAGGQWTWDWSEGGLSFRPRTRK
jgi:hypothetical protein